ncbi:hypothetical protein [Halobacteriovorax sp.]|uniref:hypothetical protein n=1 Tax=Halobacteriovorax sp. TaxID=2020862 RepID=UPI003569244F
MTKKKNGIFSKIKNKFSKDRDEESEFEESTGEIFVDPEALEFEELKEEESETSIDTDEATSPGITFSEEQEEDDIEELLNNRSDEDTPPVIEDEEEEFVAQELTISEEEKEELEELDSPIQELQPEELEEITEEYDEDLYEEPKPSAAQRFSSLISSVKNKVPSKKFISFKNDDSSDNDLTGALKKLNINEFSWTAFVEKIFSPDSRNDIHRGFLTVLILSTAYFGGKLVATGISSKLENSTQKKRTATVPYSPKTRVVLSKIERSNLFNTKDPNSSSQTVVEKPKLDDNLVCRTSERKTKLGIKLVNTIVLQDSVKSIASVQVRGKKQILDLREGERIDNDAQVGKIDRLRVVFKNLKTGDCEYIESLTKEPKVKNPIKVVSASRGKNLLNKYKDDRIKNVGNTFKIQKKVRDEMLGNISEVLTQARAIQIKNPDGTLAFKMTEIVPGSIYSKLNILDGDTITAINGKKFSSLNEIMNLFGKIKDIDNFEISVRRDGSTQNLEYNFE